MIQEYHSTHKQFEQWKAAPEAETVDQTLHQQPQYPEGSQVMEDVQKRWDTNQEQDQQQPQFELKTSDTDMGAIYNNPGSAQTLSTR